MAPRNQKTKRPGSRSKVVQTSARRRTSRTSSANRPQRRAANSTKSARRKDAQPQEPLNHYGEKRWYAVGLALAAVILGASAYWVYAYPAQGWELSTFHFFNDLPGDMRFIAISVAALGSTWMAAASVAAAFVLKMYWLSWRLAVSFLIGYGVVYGLKVLVDRSRPEELTEGAHIRVIETWPAFPSGHAMLITIIMLTLLPYLPRVWCWALTLVVVPAVALARIYLGVHLPLDLIGGVAAGVLVVCLIRVLPQAVARALRLG